ncbi:MAG: hypothetical protein H0V23_04725 [Nocardioidaceae bacterium]|nr:hypothetical protein [Nocardioidaceae bacterium]
MSNRVAGRQTLMVRIMRRFSAALVEAIKEPITLAVLDEVADVLRAGHYTRNVALALAENQEYLRDMVLEKVKEDRTVGRLSRLPFHDSVVQAATDTTLRVLLQIIVDPRTDELIGDILRQNVDQIRADVHAKGVAGAIRSVGSA